MLMVALVAGAGFVLYRRYASNGVGAPLSPVDCPPVVQITDTPTPPKAPSGRAPTPAENEVFDEISRNVEEIRGLRFKEEVKRVIMTREEISLWIRAVGSNGTEVAESRRRSEELLKFLGAFPSDTDFESSVQGTYGMAVIGVYDHEAKSLIVADDLGLISSSKMKASLAHEFTHALDDQHFDIDRLQKEVAASGEGDALVALHAALEGEAILLESEYAIRYLKNPTYAADLLDPKAYEAGLPRDIPPYVFAHLIFPYAYGGRFASTLYQQGGWKAVDNVYARPPGASNGIIHPELYIQDVAQIAVGVGPVTETIASAVSERWNLLSEGDLGELDLRLVLGSFESVPDPAAAASGWRGDAYMYVSCGAERTFVSRVVVDTDADADELEAAWRDWGAKWPQVPLAAELSTLQMPDGSSQPAKKNFVVARDGRAVTLIASNVDAMSQKLAEGL